MSRRRRIEVPGRPAPQGSHRVVVGPDGRARVLHSGARGLAEWRATVALATAQVCETPLEGPVGVEVTFRLPRPRRPAATLPIRRPDLDKLLRALLDGLQAGGAFRDDAQVTDVRARKRYGQAAPGATVEVFPVQEGS